MSGYKIDLSIYTLDCNGFSIFEHYPGKRRYNTFEEAQQVANGLKEKQDLNPDVERIEIYEIIKMR